MSHSLHLVGLNNMYDYDIESLKADIDNCLTTVRCLSVSLSRLEYELSHESEIIQEIKYRIQQLESDIDETISLSEHYNY